MQLFLLPFAGGNVHSYRKIEPILRHEQITITTLEPPGRGKRADEPLLQEMGALALDMCDLISEQSNGDDYAIFGHSFGALLAYLVAVEMRERNYSPPLHLFLSGKEPPTTDEVRNQIWHLPHDDFIKAICDYGGVPEQISSNKEIMAYFEPILRADIRAIQTYHHHPTNKLGTPLTILFGDNDLISGSQLSQWQQLTTSPITLREYHGGHFFLFEHADEIAALLHQQLISHLGTVLK